MKAIICKKYGPPENLEIVEYKDPIPKNDEVLIKIYATSVTNSDIFIRSSNVPYSMLIPFRLMIGISKPRNEIIGEVFSGVIEKVGSRIERFKVGDQVYGLTGMSLGAYADYKCMKEKDSKKGCIAIKPSNISFEEATAAAYGGLLAFQYLEKGNIHPNQKVLIYGASGTSGIIAIQLAKHLGAEVTGVCSTKNIAFIKSIGADEVLDYTRSDSLSQLEEYDVILDSVGKSRKSDLKEACKESLSKYGKYISIDDGPLILSSNRLSKIKKLVENNAIRPINDRCYNFDQIIDAHKYVELGHKKGNVAITVNTQTIASS
jgi:NADPH:quinone reductase-like Zn-dependent oxidoreductase